MKTRTRALVLMFAAAAAILGAPGCARKPAPADLVFLNGDFFTVDPAHPSARAVAINGNTITAVCDSDREARRYVGPKTRVFDLLGKFVLPGLIDAHVHFAAAGALINGANLLSVSDEAGLRKEIRRVVDLLDDGEWITDGLWGAYEQWALGDAGLAPKDKKAPWRPNRTMIDDLTPEHPCFLCRFDRKEWLANGAALAASGLGQQRLAGLEIGPDGKPTGIVLPGTPAYDRIRKAIAPKSDMRLLDESRAALQALREAGITEIHDIETPAQTRRFIELEKNGELTCRVWLRPDLSRGAELKAQGYAMGLHPGTKQKSDRLRYGPLAGERAFRPSVGSDWPGTGAAIHDLKPSDLIWAAVTGKAPKGLPEDAIHAYTINNAAAAFEDGALGSLTPGKRADITVLDKNLLKIAPEDILTVKVTHTVVDGRIVFRRRVPAPARPSR